MKKSNPKVRISFDVSQDTKALIDGLRSKTDATSLAEVFRSALALYEFILDHQAAGGKIIFQNPDKSKETIRFPF